MSSRTAVLVGEEVSAWPAVAGGVQASAERHVIDPEAWCDGAGIQSAVARSLDALSKPDDRCIVSRLFGLRSNSAVRDRFERRGRPGWRGRSDRVRGSHNRCIL